ncbi:MAG: hypothetical protein AAGF04_05600 [Chlamydiota bacterium]
MRIRRNKFHFTSLGCARNLVDSEEMIAKLLRHGYEIEGEEELADYLVVNICGFLASARQEALDTVEEIFQRKKVKAKVMVTGCVVQKEGDLIRSTFSDTHDLLGARDVEHIVEAVRSGRGSVISSGRSYPSCGGNSCISDYTSSLCVYKNRRGVQKGCSFVRFPTSKSLYEAKRKHAFCMSSKAFCKAV